MPTTADIFSAEDLSRASRCWRSRAWWSRARAPDVAPEARGPPDAAAQLLPRDRPATAATCRLAWPRRRSRCSGWAAPARRRRSRSPRPASARLRCIDAGCRHAVGRLFLAVLRQRRGRRRARGAAGARIVRRCGAAGRGDGARPARSTARTTICAGDRRVGLRACAASTPAQFNLAYKLNSVCLGDRMPWIACALAGAEIVVGPAFHPRTGPLATCATGCARSPAPAIPRTTFAFERHLDRAKRISATSGENLVFGAGIAGNMAGLEVVKMLTGASQPSLVGRLLTVSLQDLRTRSTRCCGSRGARPAIERGQRAHEPRLGGPGQPEGRPGSPTCRRRCGAPRNRCRRFSTRRRSRISISAPPTGRNGSMPARDAPNARQSFPRSAKPSNATPPITGTRRASSLAKRSELGAAITPAECVLYADEQYAAAGFHLPALVGGCGDQLDQRRRIARRARSRAAGLAGLSGVPVAARARISSRRSTSNGLAAGASLSRPC